MTAAAKSVCYFGFYLYAMALSLMVVPNFVLTTLQLPLTSEVWIRVVGVLAACIGYYYHRSGAGNISAFFPHTIPSRLFVFAAFTAFSLLGYVSPLLIVFGAVDAAGALWTYRAIQQERKRGTA